MEMLLLKSTAARVIGKGYLSADHLSDATGLDPAITISKNGGAFANPAAGASVMTEIGNGWYYFALGTADVDTLGPLIIRATHATMDAIEVVYQVVEAVTAANVTQWAGSAVGGAPNTGKVAVSLAAGDVTGNLPANLIQIGGVDQSATDLKDFADTGYSPATHKVAGVVLTDTCTTNTDMRGTDSAALAAGVLLAASQTLYAPAKAGDKMDLVDTPNATAVTAIRTEIEKSGTILKKLDTTLTADGSNYKFTADALQESPAGGGGSGDTNNIESNTTIIEGGS